MRFDQYIGDVLTRCTCQSGLPNSYPLILVLKMYHALEDQLKLTLLEMRRSNITWVSFLPKKNEKGARIRDLSCYLYIIGQKSPLAQI